MFSGFRTTLGPAVRLIGRLGISRPRLAAAIGLLFVGGGLEGATVGLLVPLLSMLTGAVSPSSGFPQNTLDVLLERLPPDSRVIALGVTILALVTVKNALSFAGVAMAGALRAKGG